MLGISHCNTDKCGKMSDLYTKLFVASFTLTINLTLAAAAAYSTLFKDPI